MCDIVDRIVRGAKRQGEELERIRVIQKKLDKGISVEVIADALEIPVEEVVWLMKKCGKENGNYNTFNGGA